MSDEQTKVETVASQDAPVDSRRQISPEFVAALRNAGARDSLVLAIEARIAKATTRSDVK